MDEMEKLIQRARRILGSGISRQDAIDRIAESEDRVVAVLVVAAAEILLRDTNHL